MSSSLVLRAQSATAFRAMPASDLYKYPLAICMVRFQALPGSIAAFISLFIRGTISF
jgi:hypothetical protein